MQQTETVEIKDGSALDVIVGRMMRQYNPDALRRALATRSYDAYLNDPVAFGEDLFGETYTDDVKRLMESVRDNMITVAQSATGTGKTHAAARVAVWFYLVHGRCQIYTAAAPPEDNLRKLLWGEIGGLIHKYPDYFLASTRSGLHLAKTPNDFLTGVTIPASGTRDERVSKFSGKHSPNLLFILDEGDAIPDEVYEGIEGCMSGGNARLLVMFNPKQRMGMAYRMIRDGQASVVELSAFNHPNVRSGEDVIPGAVNRETTVRRLNQWSRPLKVDEVQEGDDVFTLPEFLVGATAKNPAGGGQFDPLPEGKRKVLNPALSYMVLGRYPAQGVNQLISTEWIYAARGRWDAWIDLMGEKFPEGVQPIMGLDTAEMGIDYNCVYLRGGGFVARSYRWNKVDPLATGDKAAELFRKNNCIRCFVDANGVGAGVAPHMRRLGVESHSVKVQERPTMTTEIGEFRILRDQLYWQMREWLRTDPDSKLPPDEDLIEELMVPTYDIVRGKIEVMRKDDMKEMLGRSPDSMDALALTFSRSTPEYHVMAGGPLPQIVTDSKGWT